MYAAEPVGNALETGLPDRILLVRVLESVIMKIL